RISRAGNHALFFQVHDCDGCTHVQMPALKAFSEWLGLNVEPRDLTLLQVSLRGVIVFIAALVLLRIADRRFLAKLSAFDALLGFILASMLARAINGSASFLPT